MSPKATASSARPRLLNVPFVMAGLVFAVMVLVTLPLLLVMGEGVWARQVLAPLLQLAGVVWALLVVLVLLQPLGSMEPPGPGVSASRGKTAPLLAGIAVAGACHFLAGLVMYSGPALVPVANGGVVFVSQWLSVCARLAEVVALGLYASRWAAPGTAKVWLAGAGALALAVVVLAMGPLPAAYARMAGGAMPQIVSGGMAIALVAVAVVLLRSALRGDPSHGKRFAWVVLALACAEFVGAFWQGALVGDIVVLALRMLAYALLYQAVFDTCIREPFVRIQEAESRLSLLGRNLPHSVLFQILRDAQGDTRFVHIGEGIERLVGVSAHDAMRDASLLYGQVFEEDRERLRQAEQTASQSLQSMEIVFRVRRPQGDVRWMHVGASPRLLHDGSVILDGVQTDITVHHLSEAATHAHEASMASMLRQMPGGVARLDRDLRVLYVNDQQAQWLFRAPSELQGQHLPDVIPSDVMVLMQPYFDRAFAGETAVFENRIDGRDGVQFRHTTIAPEAVTEQGVATVMVFAYDVTALKQAQQELVQQKAHLSRVVNAMPDMVFLKDAEGLYLSVNPVFERFAGRPALQIVGCTDYDLRSRDEADRFRKYDLRAMQAWQPLVYEETLTFAEDGYVGQFETIKTPIRDIHDRVTGVLGVCRDITDRKRSEQEIERLAFYDALTGLPNRRLLLDRLQRSITACQRSKNLGALLFIDLDNFKDLNDTLGHDMGDQLLSQVATRLVSSVREADTVARFGGDEFVVMLDALAPDTQSAAAQAETVADKLLASLNQPFVLQGGQHYSTPSIGITLFGDERLNVDELLKRADLAMYQAKAAGRNTQRFFDPHMQAAVNARSHLEADLRQGLARGELLVHYQPVVDHHSQLLGAEALVRWRHPERGLISPGDFIPLAEQTGLILPLGQYVLETACAQLQSWSQHPNTAHLTVAVNVSARQFRQPDFVAQVLQTLQNHHADPQKLKLELTESLLLGDIEDTIARMAQLKKQGVGFALDDFGTGYSSLSYLKRLPLDQVKIDQSFVRDVLTDPNDAAIVRTILALAKSLDLDVVAEGVETGGQLTFLRLHGCEAFQGYLFGRPVPVDLFVREHLADGLMPPSVAMHKGLTP